MPYPLPILDPTEALGEVWNELVEAIRSREVIAVVGGDLQEAADGKTIIIRGGAAGTKQVYRVQIPAGGIATGASAAVFYYDSTHALSASTITAWNRSGVSMGGVSAKIGYASWIAEEGEYHLTTEVCP